MTDLFAATDRRSETDRKRTASAVVEKYHAALVGGGAVAKTGPCFACMLATCTGCSHDASAPCAADGHHKRGYRFLADDGTPAGDGSVCAKCFWSARREMAS